MADSIEHVRIKENKCLICGYLMNAATIVGEKNFEPPKAGDLTICFSCGNVMAFTEYGGLRPTTREERMEYRQDIIAIKNAFVEMRMKGKRNLPQAKGENNG